MRHTTVRFLTACLVGAMLAAGCGATTGPLGPDDDPGISPAQQCQLLQTSASAAETGVLLAKIKDDKIRIAVFAALDGVKAGAKDYCDAVAAGKPADALASVLAGFDATLASLNAQLRANQSLPAPPPPVPPVEAS